jgi:hypothetical protein
MNKEVLSYQKKKKGTIGGGDEGTGLVNDKGAG